MRRLALIRPALLATAALLAAPPLLAQTSWRWSGTLSAGRAVHIHNVNGAVEVEPGSGTTVEVIAEKKWRRGNPEDVRIEARQAGSGGDLTICALWGPTARCEPDGIVSGRTRIRNNDVSVKLTIKVPANARVDAHTVNGGVTITGLTGDVEISTVNGSITARNTSGAVSGSTVNGSITARTTPSATTDVAFETVNGSITLELPTTANADVDLSVVNGRITSALPVLLEGELSRRKVKARIGTGGPDLRASTVNGSITIKTY